MSCQPATVCSLTAERPTAILPRMTFGLSSGATFMHRLFQLYIYEKYKERGGQPVFHPGDLTPFTSLLTDIYNLASSSDYVLRGQTP